MCRAKASLLSCLILFFARGTRQTNSYNQTATTRAMSNLRPNDARFDEDLGGPRDPCNLISFPEDSEFYKATKCAMPWQVGGAHAPNRFVVPSMYIEGLFGESKVEGPFIDQSNRTADRILTKCLGVEQYLADNLELLIDEGLIQEEGDGGELWDFTCYDELKRRADELIRGRPDDAALTVTAASLEWLEDVTPGNPTKEIEWYHDITWDDATKREGNLKP